LSKKFALQASQYKFPYHYIPQSHIDGYEDLKVTARVDWGLEYLMTLDKVVIFLKDSGADEVLDLGCGDGRLAERIRSSSLNIKYTGIDLVPDAISLAKSMNPKENYQVLDLEDLKNSFAYISSIEVLEHISDQDIPGFLAGVKAKLKPGGKFVVTVPSDVRPVHRKHYRHYSDAMLREQLEDAGLSVLHCEEFYHEGALASFITRLLSNSFFTVNHIGLKKALLKILVRQVRKKTKARGTHLFAIAELV
jgi:SAM-dependent methyltransferase